MLVICVKTGLTYARKVHREGEIFIITGKLESEYKNLSNEAWNRKQKRTYSGDITFRQPTSDEIIAAIRDKKLDPGSAAIRQQLSKKQLRIAYDYAESKEAKKIKAIQMLKEGLDMEIEDAPEKKVEVIKVPEPVEVPEKEVVKAPEKEAEAPVEELELVEEPVKEPEKEAEAPPEEPVEEPKKEAPEEEPKEPVEEPKKEAPEKKDKKKDK